MLGFAYNPTGDKSKKNHTFFKNFLQDTLIQECIEKTLRDSPNELSWQTLKKYGIIIWFENLERIRNYIEIIAKNEFAKTQLFIKRL